MSHHDTMNWWLTTYNQTAANVNNAQTVIAARHASPDQPNTHVGTKRHPKPEALLYVTPHHSKHATGTAAGRFICAFAAHRAAWEETNGKDRSTRLWKLAAVVAIIATIIAITTAITGGEASTIIIATVLALVCAAASWPIARWSLAGKRDAFYHCLTRAVEDAGADSANEYITLGAFEHTTVLHNIDRGFPATPKRLHQAIHNAVDKAAVRP